MADVSYMQSMQIYTSNFNKPAEGAPNNDNSSDSGYGSLFSTPNEGEGSLGSKTSSDAKSDFLGLDVGHWPKKRILRVFEREIPESAISQLQDWKVLFSKLLWESVSKAAPAASNSNISMKLKHLGTNESDLTLYLVFFCDKKLAKHVRKFVTQGHVVEEMRGQFLPQVIPHGPRLLHGEELYTPKNQGIEMSPCGMALYYFADNDGKGKIQSGLDDSTLRVGTLGGIVKVSFQEGVSFYGLTTRHLFEAEGSSIARSFENDEESEEEEWDEIELLHSSILGGSNSKTELFYEEDAVRQRISREDTMLLGTWEDILHDRNMFDAKPGDWALIGLSGMQFVHPNFIPARRLQFGLRDRLQDPSSFRHDEVMGSVVACGRSIGPMDVYDLSLKWGGLTGGDSGSWVVDPQTGKVFGHVVASDILTEAYVLPMAEILRQIRDFSDAQDAEIVTSSEIMAYCCAKMYKDFHDEADGPSAFDDVEARLSVFDIDHSGFKWQYEDQRRRWDPPPERLHYQSVDPQNDAGSTVGIPAPAPVEVVNKTTITRDVSPARNSTPHTTSTAPSIYERCEYGEEVPVGPMAVSERRRSRSRSRSRSRKDIRAEIEALEAQLHERRRHGNRELLSYVSYVNQNHTPWNPIRQRYDHQSVDASSSADSGSSHASASTLPTIYSFNEDAEALESFITTTTNKRRLRKK
ncbi:hypothetical protein LX32DRAFT_732511 [Colletotrichum zoysiae]|uniref:Uncharacterized protein n=1 Tax=Colletotrichum zoysiae TaxID=1216348 RepID=A0AAD9H5N1_9PEZI|nr:hypothetical protein LX32DRAFT_732511 [Colletotrichum zoysiae]